MNKNTIYLYPKVFPSENPYISNLENSLTAYYEVVNKENNTKGVIDLFKYIFKARIYYFNWIENLPSRRFGKAQVIVFLFFLLLAKCLRMKIVWTLHNKYSHDRKSSRWTDFMFSTMFRFSDFIITHSQSGVEFTKEKYPAFESKIKYFIHPIKKLYPSGKEKERIYDFFIWGTIWPYKGVIEFLRFLKESGNNHFKILIAGICINDQVKAELEQYLNDNVIYLNKFFEFAEIAEFANQSKFTLFTYNKNSVLSSGSLMDSIAMKSAIIGPDTGAFNDLSSFGFVNTYHTFNDIIGIYNKSSMLHNQTEDSINAFWRENNWEIFGEKLYNSLTNLLK